MVVAGALSAPVHSDLESHAACPSRLRRSISLFLHGVRSPAQALQDHAKQSSVCTMLNTDRCSPRQINMDCTGRRCQDRRCWRPYSNIAFRTGRRHHYWDQRGCCLSGFQQQTAAVILPPLKHLVRVHTGGLRRTRHTHTWL